MKTIKVVYWSQSGNTKSMAEAIGKGITSGGAQAEVVEVSDISLSDVKDENVLALGSPAMGAEVIEEVDMEPLVEALETCAAGKKIALFGSYGWGDGQWMRDWEDRMSKAGAEIISGEGLICMETPEEETLNRCRELGKTMAELS